VGSGVKGGAAAAGGEDGLINRKYEYRTWNDRNASLPFFLALDSHCWEGDRGVWKWL